MPRHLLDNRRLSVAERRTAAVMYPQVEGLLKHLCNGFVQSNWEFCLQYGVNFEDAFDVAMPAFLKTHRNFDSEKGKYTALLAAKVRWDLFSWRNRLLWDDRSGNSLLEHLTEDETPTDCDSLEPASKDALALMERVGSVSQTLSTLKHTMVSRFGWTVNRFENAVRDVREFLFS